MFTSETVAELKAFPKFEFGNRHPKALKALKALKIREETGIHDFYKSGGWLPPNRRYQELYLLFQLIENIEKSYGLYGMEEEYRTPELLRRYLQLDSIEGGGSWQYDVETDAVYDCDWGAEYNMVAGTKEPTFKTSYDFINWLYSDPDKD